MVDSIKKIENLYYLQIGVQGENIANAIQIDIASWISAIPNAHIHVLFKPYNSNLPSPVASELDGTILTWRPSYSSTAVPGVGYTEVRAIDADTGLVKKSRIIPTSVENSVSGTDSTVIPSPFQEWVNQVLAVKDSAVEAAEIIQAKCQIIQEVIENADAAVAQMLNDAVSNATAVAYGLGGRAGQYFRKRSALNYDTEWITIGMFVVDVDCGTVSSLPVTINNSNITDDMSVIATDMSNPSAQIGDWTVSASNGSVTISGNISGSTSLKLFLVGATGTNAEPASNLFALSSFGASMFG